MLDIKFIRDNIELIKKTAEQKLVEIDVDRLIEIDKILKDKNATVEQLRSERNTLSTEIPSLQGDKKQESVDKVKKLKDEIANIEEEIEPLKAEFQDLMYRVPNPTLPEVPVGKSDAENVELRKVGEIRKFEFEPKSHIDLGLDLGFDLGFGLGLGLGLAFGFAFDFAFAFDFPGFSSSS